MVDVRKLQAKMRKEGAFVTLEQARIKGEITPDETGRFLAQVFEWLEEIVQEGKKETKRLEQVLGRMEALARRQKQRRGPVPLVHHETDAFENEVHTLLGWVASLYETQLKIYSFINPQDVPEKLRQMASAQFNLWSMRQASGKLMRKDSSAFKELMS
ncbi:MAG: hypothetical protein J0H41_01795 [Rhizobiales bacterium]|nr:hypothetical protein [Hyphomicrobiales bacterium]